MRTLKFNVNGQTIKQDPTCSFEGLYPGSEGYLMAEFTFDKEWENAVKVVGFFSNMGKEYEPQLLKDGKTCLIPTDALKNRVFKMQIIGKNAERKLITNKLAINQKGG